MNSSYILQSVLVPNDKGIGPKRAEAKARSIADKKPLKTTLEANYYHSRFESPESVKKKGYTRYASKKLSDGTILTLAYKK